jgi:hypothetical protein
MDPLLHTVFFYVDGRQGFECIQEGTDSIDIFQLHGRVSFVDSLLLFNLPAFASVLAHHAFLGSTDVSSYHCISKERRTIRYSRSNIITIT